VFSSRPFPRVAACLGGVALSVMQECYIIACRAESILFARAQERTFPMHDQTAFFSLLLITTLAAVVPALAARFRQFYIPVVIGEIFVGILIGKSGLNLIEPSPILEFLSEFGFVFLMFISGLEVDLSAFSSANGRAGRTAFWKTPLFLAFTAFLLTLAGSFAAAWKLEQMGLVENPIIMGLILSTTSLGIVVPILKERDMAGTGYGQLVLLAALIADFLTLVLLGLAFSLLKTGFVLHFTLLLALLALFGAGIRLGVHARRVRAMKKLKRMSSATSQIRVRGSIALMVAWVALARLLGTEVILGAFMAGVIVSVMAGSGESSLREKLDAMGFGFFIPIFFISVGTRFDFQALVQSPGALMLLPLLVLAAYAVKLVPALLFRLAFSWRESLAAGLLLSSRLSLIIAASALALDLGIIGADINAIIIVLAAVTCMLSPLLFNRIAPAAQESERHGVIVIGINHLTSPLVERLSMEGETVNVLKCPWDSAKVPPDRCSEIITGNPEDEKTLAKLGAERAGALVSVLDDPEMNVNVCRMAAETFGIPVIVSRADDPAVLSTLRDMGVRVIQPGLATVLALEGALRFPAAFDMLSEHRGNMEIGESAIRNRRFDGAAVQALRLPGNTLVMGIRRDGDVIVPRGDTVLKLGDVLMLVGKIDDVEEAKRMLRSRS
jgi:Kef-type K+ transport system membrane component KefB/Trk K+ transport system NAD-binding subunit